MDGFTDREWAFVQHYLDCLNGAEAARRAGFSKNAARQQAQRLLSKDYIRDAIQEGMKARAMPADEVLARLSAIASADIRELFDFDDAGKMTKLKLTRDAPLHLIKSITPTAKGLKVDLHDAHAALVKLGEYHKLFGGKNINLNLTPDDLKAMSDDDLDRLAEQLDKAAR